MKSQDIGLLLKLRAMEISGNSRKDGSVLDFTARGLEMETGISKTQISLSLKQSLASGLVFKDRITNSPRVNTQALFDFIVYGLRYVFPVGKGELTRGIGTAFSAPMLQGKLLNAGELDLVWPDAWGKTKGQSIEPLFKTAPYAAKRDPVLYELLALVDAIRLGQPRERNLATDLLKKRMVGKS